ncbi:hypothetical protein A3SI_11844 [Nitritalea halalkaliphila LW7]|uniref:Uncharacterized protein n=1 Tax=Nitritalea halalkaliphila LW7 TaxID=1189621 RepID=I5C2J6_9BACT|nr:hypothetical protein [Nitritalea halalkaliphila]EIM76048.1 hypothetical protein A3SI_11844 [Nitritalea halalkaliphila LW7]
MIAEWRTPKIRPSGRRNLFDLPDARVPEPEDEEIQKLLDETQIQEGETEYPLL